MNTNDNSDYHAGSPAQIGNTHASGASNETVMQRLAREENEARDNRNRQRAEARAWWKQFLQKIVLAFRLFFYDRVVRRATGVIEGLRRIREREQALAANEDAQAQTIELRRSRRRAWVVLIAAFVAASADILFVLPNIGYALASRFAGGEEPTAWEKVSAFGVLEIAILVLLLTVKSLSYTRPHLEARNRTRDTPEYNAARCRLWGARLARTTYVLLISFAFALNILAEIGKLDYAQGMWRILRSSETTQGGVVIEKEREQDVVPVLVPGKSKGDENAGSFLSRIPITAGVFVLIWALHIVVLFLPPGEFVPRGVGEFTPAELERLDRALTQGRDSYLLRINGKLKSAKQDEQKYSAMIERTPDAVLRELDRLMGKAPAPQVRQAPPTPAQDSPQIVFGVEENFKPQIPGEHESVGPLLMFQHSSNGANGEKGAIVGDFAAAEMFRAGRV